MLKQKHQASVAIISPGNQGLTRRLEYTGESLSKLGCQMSKDANTVVAKIFCVW
jgi:hypothetical protein